MTFNIGEITGLRQRRRWHDGKVSYPSKGKAQAALRALKARGERENGQALIDGDALEIYPCRTGDYGRHFHIGHRRRKHGEEEEGSAQECQ